jgi:hypothetical protein
VIFLLLTACYNLPDNLGNSAIWVPKTRYWSKSPHIELCPGWKTANTETREVTEKFLDRFSNAIALLPDPCQFSYAYLPDQCSESWQYNVRVRLAKQHELYEEKNGKLRKIANGRIHYSTLEEGSIEIPGEGEKSVGEMIWAEVILDYETTDITHDAHELGHLCGYEHALQKRLGVWLPYTGHIMTKYAGWSGTETKAMNKSISEFDEELLR